MERQYLFHRVQAGICQKLHQTPPVQHMVLHGFIHTPTEYRPVGRLNNVSNADNNMSVRRNAAGIAYDYTIANIPVGHPKNSSATTFSTAQSQRLLYKE